MNQVDKDNMRECIEEELFEVVERLEIPASHLKLSPEWTILQEVVQDFYDAFLEVV